ncbi:MAG: hypothetical protein ABEJ06_02885 [Haloarculaceae archaeon]
MTTPALSPDRTDDGDQSRDLAAIVEPVDDTVECTLYPRGASEVDLMSHWMTARGDAFVSLDTMR